MPCHQHPAQSCCKLGEKQGTDHQGGCRGEDQGTCVERAVKCAKRDDGVCCCSGVIRCLLCIVFAVGGPDIFSDDLKSQLLEMGICDVLIPLTDSPSLEVQGNSAAALGNLSMKGKC